MQTLLQQERFNIISPANKAFILAFDAEMNRLGYDFGGQIGSGYCWGRYMIIYAKTGVKSKNVVARIYIRDESIVLRLFLNQLDKHRAYLEATPAYIKEVFVGPRADCRHDKDDGTGNCMFRKSYTLEGRLIEKCNGETFEFHDPAAHELGDYIALFTEFFPQKKAKAG